MAWDLACCLGCFVAVCRQCVGVRNDEEFAVPV